MVSVRSRRFGGRGNGIATGDHGAARRRRLRSGERREQCHGHDTAQQKHHIPVKWSRACDPAGDHLAGHTPMGYTILPRRAARQRPDTYGLTLHGACLLRPLETER
ncbi:MAG: hypothetical protein ACREK1_00510 [Longimicrobiales bacterium]